MEDEEEKAGEMERRYSNNEDGKTNLNQVVTLKQRNIQRNIREKNDVEDEDEDDPKYLEEDLEDQDEGQGGNQNNDSILVNGVKVKIID